MTKRNKNEFNIKLDTHKIQYLFYNIRKLNGAKGLLAKKLRIGNTTLDEYLKQGDKLLNDFEEELEPMFEIDIDEIDENIMKTKMSFVDEFLEQEGLNRNSLTELNKNAFEVYFIERKERMKEKIIYDFQREFLESIILSDKPLEDKRFKLLIQFRLIYDRAQMSLDEELLYLKNKYAKTSSKQVGILVKDIERRNKEDFGDDKKSEQKQITVNQQFNNFTHYAIEYNKAMKLMDKQNNDDNDDDVIDINL